jgi:iron(III) transport system substrate-binding protein
VIRSLSLAVLAAVLLAACSFGPKEDNTPQQIPDFQQGAGSAWPGLLNAGKREGIVSVVGPADEKLKAALTQVFQQRSGITIQYLPNEGPTTTAQIMAERQRGTYLWDIYIGDPAEALTIMVPNGAFDPLDTHIVLDDVKDPSNWRDNGIEYADGEKQVAVMTQFQRATLFVNTNLVGPDEITSYRDLLDPRWRGRILTDDPRSPGNGQGTFAFFYRHPELGPDFIRSLSGQGLAVSKSPSEAMSGLASGQYAILVGGAIPYAEDAIKEGAPIAPVNVKSVKEGSDVTAGYGALAIFRHPAHPSAADVYLNWILSKEGQNSLVRATGYLSRRLDIPVDDKVEWRVPAPSVAGKSYSRDAIEAQQELDPLLAQVLAGQ